MNKLSALDLAVIQDTLIRTLSISGFENALGGYTKQSREVVANKIQSILSNINVSFDKEDFNYQCYIEDYK